MSYLSAFLLGVLAMWLVAKQHELSHAAEEQHKLRRRAFEAARRAYMDGQVVKKTGERIPKEST